MSWQRLTQPRHAYLQDALICAWATYRRTLEGLPPSRHVREKSGLWVQKYCMRSLHW